MALHAGTVTRRRVNCDITVLTVGGANVLAYFRDCSYTFSGELIDVTAAQDSWMKRELCRKDLEFTLGKIMYEDEDLATLFIAGSVVYVSCDIAGKTLYFLGLIENAGASSGDPMTETGTIRLANGTPTLV